MTARPTSPDPIPVNVSNFIRAETDLYFARFVQQGRFGKLGHKLNNLTAQPNPDGSFTIQFGGCGRDTPNCLPIMPGWNYIVRLYRPRKEVLDGTWKLSEAHPVR